MTPSVIPPETYRRIHDCLQCDECGATTALPRLGLRHNLGCKSTGGLAALTPREKQIALMIAEGQEERQIAETLGLAQRTVQCHRYNMYRRIGVKKSTQLVCLLYDAGILKPKAKEGA